MVQKEQELGGLRIAYLGPLGSYCHQVCVTISCHFLGPVFVFSFSIFNVHFQFRHADTFLFFVLYFSHHLFSGFMPPWRYYQSVICTVKLPLPSAISNLLEFEKLMSSPGIPTSLSGVPKSHSHSRPRYPQYPGCSPVRKHRCWRCTL
jgi:hypothetical protein